MLNQNEYRQSIINMRNRTLKLDHEGGFWTDNERKQLKRMFENGTGITEMANILKRTEPAIYQQIQLMNLYEEMSVTGGRPKNNCRKSRCKCQRCNIRVQDCPLHIPLMERGDAKFNV